MIRLDFDVIDALGHIDPRELPTIVEGEIATELFPCRLRFEVNRTDLSWDACIPMVDFARSMFLAAKRLGPDNPETLFGSVEYVTRWSFTLAGARVSISRDDLAGRRAECGLEELVRATADFGVRVYDALLEALPAIQENRFLARWYPYDEMKRRSEIRRAIGSRPRRFTG